MRSTRAIPGRGSRWAPILASAALVVSSGRAALGQQQPIFGCRHAISCRNSPLSNSALNDAGTSGLLVGGSARWGPGLHPGPVAPLLKIPAVEPSESIELHGFHLRNVTLLPAPEPAPPPPQPTPAPARPE